MIFFVDIKKENKRRDDIKSFNGIKLKNFCNFLRFLKKERKKDSQMMPSFVEDTSNRSLLETNFIENDTSNEFSKIKGDSISKDDNNYVKQSSFNDDYTTNASTINNRPKVEIKSDDEDDEDEDDEIANPNKTTDFSYDEEFRLPEVDWLGLEAKLKEAQHEIEQQVFHIFFTFFSLFLS
jgi:hypothetical protein